MSVLLHAYGLEPHENDNKNKLHFGTFIGLHPEMTKELIS